MAILFLVLLGFITYMVWQAQRKHDRNTFDIWDLVMDTLPDGTRRASGIKVAFQLSFLTTTWVIVDNELKATLNDGIFGLYLGTWCASLITKVIFDKPDPPKFMGDHDK
jgi:hypothetical protein